jgi:hypothetical protein
VVASASPDVAEGARLFGYFPMGTHMRLVPSRVGDAGLTDATAHRASLPSAYNAYRFAPADPTDDRRAVLTPPFALGFLLDDALEAGDDHGAAQIVVSSASSKTAIATAHRLAARGVRVVGLTSAANADFVAALGPYAQTLTYEAIGSELPVEPSVYADISGDAAVRLAVHERLGEQLRASLIVGATHWEDVQGGGELPGPAPTMFFAPDRMKQRAGDWTPAGLDERMGEALRSFAEWSAGWLRIERASGGDAVRAAYLDVLEGRVAPDAAHVLNL